ncbi:hypothetical protein BB560_004660 [Smittium megazygosporum]|uniref:P-type phospholipid transporter n=1 Tax=Smittium megazygosporum TaxID=133381 RepID=A0A2T9Z8L9_9FUNG|nr:hypothetical protein BB560_004660 [Smittium megazygosporum]
MSSFDCKISALDSSSEYTSYPGNIKNILLRDMLVRNTDWVIGLVLYTGIQTKVVMNTGSPKFKRSKIEVLMNKMIIVNFFILIIVAIVLATVATVMYRNDDKVIGHLLYLNGSKSNSSYFFTIFISSLYMIQYIIPISLYISIELIKLGQVFFILNDNQMYYDKKDLPCVPKNWSISDDLGQVEYVFSDKTGTLTNNVMTFRKCSINGIVYGKHLPGDELDVDKGKAATSNVKENQRLFSNPRNSMEPNEVSFDSRPSISTTNHDQIRHNMISDYNDALLSVFTPKYFNLNPADQEALQNVYSFVDPKIFRDMDPSGKTNSEPTIPSHISPQAQSEMIDLFLTQLAVNNTVLVNQPKPGSTKELSKKRTLSQSSRITLDNLLSGPRKDTPAISSNEPITFSGESPDESALVMAARNFGYTFLGKKDNTTVIDVKGQTIKYEIVSTIEFDSTRKRMSTIVRRPAPYNDIVVFCKGADSVILDLLSPVDPSDHQTSYLREKAFKDLDDFANSGLRTLVLAYRVISESELEKFLRLNHTAQTCVDDTREQKFEEAAAFIEHDFELTGCTAIEDKLQENVAECIASLRSAGIHVWVLTGDKMETAINIGFASNLITKDMELWTLSGKKSQQEVLDQFWLISKLVRQTLESTGYDTDLLSLRHKETKSLLNISHSMKRVSKYVKNLGKSKKPKLNDDDLVSQSISLLAKNNQSSSSSHQSEALQQNIGITYDKPENEDSSLVKNENAFVIDGKALGIILNNSECRRELSTLAPVFKSVICTRVSPLQKAQVVSMIKTELKVITLAIGDGANDVSMIQNANVGVAIVGEEGMQASNAADYSFGRHVLQKRN